MLDPSAIAPLNDLISDVDFQIAFAPSGDVGFRPIGDAHQTVIGSLTEVIAESQQNGTWDRFKCCELPTCGWSFYDSPRSRTKRWCSMKTCGSRHKAREYYKRAIARNPSDVRSYLYLAQELEKLLQRDEAITVLERVLNVRPYYREALDLVGKLYVQSDRREAAVAVGMRLWISKVS